MAKPSIKSKPVMVAIKVPVRDLKLIRQLARKYAAGNFSAWLRYTGLRYKPKRGEQVK